MNSPPKLHPGLNLGPAHGDDHEAAENSIFGFWVFMMSDLVTFGMFFALYATALHATAGGPGPKDLFDLSSVAWQTGFLLVSSLTSGLALLHVKTHHHRSGAAIGPMLFWLLATVALGGLFLWREIGDFQAMAAQGALPTRSNWLSSLWALVGLHGLHVSIGMLWALVIALGVLLRGVDQRWKLTLLRWGVFWHFLDIVWIAIFSFVYLGGLR
ncbi:MAG: hypothetical protein KDK99_12810 [Verrucomicrobiales bacterium]|nr:hypothetical protein [Verrucomicrobiales bacterium]